MRLSGDPLTLETSCSSGPCKTLRRNKERLLWLQVLLIPPINWNWHLLFHQLVCQKQHFAFQMDNDLNLRYSYKDEQMTFIPSISLPSNVASFAFKRQFSPSDKLSYWYNFDSNYWSTVYKHTVGKDLKLKAGYDSEVRLGWASLWLGDEDGKAKTAPMKMKVQFMLQVPQDDIAACASITFRQATKKRFPRNSTDRSSLKMFHPP
ncbi:hypothetical protein H6P81_012992 [Aristolochia fimbriata]|uniref:Uncharacterized protein n=1 Tax=Aristolochia fimbriata TaxID=158543 RepID=A0AAV7EDY6_ARIFI|nr:hypothetical protein H6P81_012992 [Aristolochia fimbriata]